MLSGLSRWCLRTAWITFLPTVNLSPADGAGDAGLGPGASRGHQLCAGGEAAIHPAHRLQLEEPVLGQDGAGLRHIGHTGTEHFNTNAQV